MRMWGVWCVVGAPLPSWGSGLRKLERPPSPVPFCYLWANGPREAECRLKATQQSADRGLGPAFLPVLPPCLRSVLFVLKPVPGLCWSLCVCVFCFALSLRQVSDLTHL